MSKFVQITSSDKENPIILNVDCIKSIENLCLELPDEEDVEVRIMSQNDSSLKCIISDTAPCDIIIETTDNEVYTIHYGVGYDESVAALYDAISSKLSYGFFDGKTDVIDEKHKFVAVTAFHDDKTYTDENGNIKRYKQDVTIRIDTIVCFYIDVDPITKKSILKIETMDGKTIILDNEDYIETKTRYKKKYISRREPSDAQIFITAINKCNETKTLYCTNRYYR